jgi:hypothetical protein
LFSALSVPSKYPEAVLLSKGAIAEIGSLRPP